MHFPQLQFWEALIFGSPPDNLPQRAMSSTIDVTSSCNCGTVTFKAAGDVWFNFLCHCKACSHSPGVSLSHVIGVSNGDFKVTLGARQHKGSSAEHRQKFNTRILHKVRLPHLSKPSDAKFHGLLSVTFKIENKKDETGRVKLPESMQPTGHTNYESCLLYYNDMLPKFLKVPPGPRLNSDCSPYIE